MPLTGPTSNPTSPFISFRQIAAHAAPDKQGVRDMAQVIVEDWKEWRQRHGDQWLSVDGVLLFADGASSDPQDRWRKEPNPDRYQRLLDQRRYAEIRVERAENHFTALKSALLGNAPPFHWNAKMDHLYGPSHRDAEQDLIILRDAVKHWDAEIKRLTKAIDATPEARAQRQEAKRRKRLERIEAQRIEAHDEVTRQRIAAIIC